MRKRLIIGSRGSQLALAQTNQMAERIGALGEKVRVSVKVIKTQGDKVLDRPLSQIEGKGLFTKELEAALLDGQIDLAVHSLKDMETTLPEGLELGTVPQRENPSDALVSEEAESLDSLPTGARVGTSSLRRKAQLLAYRPDLDVVDLRGNIDTRLGRVTEGQVDAAILACAGLARLGRSDAIVEVLSPDVMLPAIGQGALGIEIRSEDAWLRVLLAALDDPHARAEVTAERALLHALEGGCQVPIGALGRAGEGRLSLRACVCSLDGSEIIKTQVEGATECAVELGKRGAENLLKQGAGRLIAAAR